MLYGIDDLSAVWSIPLKEVGYSNFVLIGRLGYLFLGIGF